MTSTRPSCRSVAVARARLSCIVPAGSQPVAMADPVLPPIGPGASVVAGSGVSPGTGDGNGDPSGDATGDASDVASGEGRIATAYGDGSGSGGRAAPRIAQPAAPAPIATVAA